MKNKNYTEKIKNSTKTLAIWTFLWVFSMAFVAFGPKFLWNHQNLITILVLIINMLLGFVMIWANINYLKTLDELERKLNFDAMGVALGVGVVVGLSYSLLDTNNIIPFDAEISHLVIIISLTYMITLIIGKLRYQ